MKVSRVRKGASPRRLSTIITARAADSWRSLDSHRVGRANAMVHTRHLGRGKQVGRFVDEWAEHERECPSLLGLGPLGYLPCLPPARVCRNRHVRQPSPASVTSSTLVAGFDFDFRYGSSQDLLLKVCLDAARSRARRLQVCWRSERLGAEGLRCVINGNGRRLDLLAHALERDLPLVAEGAAHAGLTAGRRRQLGVGFADLYVRGRDTRSHGPWQWRGAAHTRYYFAPYDVAHPGGPIALSARLRAPRASSSIGALTVCRPSSSSRSCTQPANHFLNTW